MIFAFLLFFLLILNFFIWTIPISIDNTLVYANIDFFYHFFYFFFGFFIAYFYIRYFNVFIFFLLNFLSMNLSLAVFFLKFENQICTNYTTEQQRFSGLFNIFFSFFILILFFFCFFLKKRKK